MVASINNIRTVLALVDRVVERNLRERMCRRSIHRFLLDDTDAIDVPYVVEYEPAQTREYNCRIALTDAQATCAETVPQGDGRDTWRNGQRSSQWTSAAHPVAHTAPWKTITVVMLERRAGILDVIESTHLRDSPQATANLRLLKAV